MKKRFVAGNFECQLNKSAENFDEISREIATRSYKSFKKLIAREFLRNFARTVKTSQQIAKIATFYFPEVLKPCSECHV